MQLQLHTANRLEIQPAISERHATCVAGERECERVEAPPRLEPRETRRFPRRAAAKERAKRTVEPPEYLLLRPEVCLRREQSGTPQFTQFSRLIYVFDGDTMLAPRAAPLLKRSVVELTAARELSLQSLPLPTGWVQAKSVGALHEHMFPEEPDTLGSASRRGMIST
jgi:hypothetical protein